MVGGEGGGREGRGESLVEWQWRGQNLVRLCQNVRSISKKKMFLVFFLNPNMIKIF